MKPRQKPPESTGIAGWSWWDRAKLRAGKLVGAVLVRLGAPISHSAGSHDLTGVHGLKPVRRGLNAPCGCGSGKKFKRCCGKAA